MSDPAIRSVVVFTPYLWEHALVSLRIIRPLQQAGITLLCGNVGMDIHPELVEQADAVVIQREFPENIAVYDQILTLARAGRKPIIYEIDDLLFELPENHIDYPTHYYSRALFAMLRAVIEADLVTTSSLPLKEYLKRFNSYIETLPVYLDDKLWPLSPPSQDIDSTINGVKRTIIGYMGSNTHQPDLEPIAPILMRLLTRYKDKVGLRFWSAEPPEILRQHPQVEWIPVTLHNYAEFARYFSTQKCDLFVAPLIDSPFNRCKSAVKYLEYSSLGIPGVYSNITPYQSLIIDGQNGYLAASEAEWESRISELIELPELRATMGYQAYQTVSRDWLLSQHAEDWAEVYHQAWLRAQEPHDQSSKQDYLDLFVAIANQVWGWQKIINSQLIERDQKILDLQNEVAQKSTLINELQAKAGVQEGFFHKVIKRLDHQLMQIARDIKKRIYG